MKNKKKETKTVLTLNKETVANLAVQSDVKTGWYPIRDTHPSQCPVCEK